MARTPEGTGQKKRRRSRWRVLLIALLSTPLALFLILLVLLVLPFFVVRVDTPRAWLLARTRLPALFGPDARLRIDRVERVDPWGLRLRGVRLETTRNDTIRTLARITRVDATWRPGDLLARSVVVDHVVLDSVDVDLTLLPERLVSGEAPKPGQEAAPIDTTNVPATSFSGPGKVPPIHLDSLSVTSLVLRRGREAWARGGLTLRELHHYQSRFTGRLAHARVVVPRESIDVVLRGGEIRGQLGQRMRLDGLSIEQRGLTAALTAEWSSLPPDPPEVKRGRVQGDVEFVRLEPQSIAPLRRIRLPLGAEDDLRGALRFRVDLASGSKPRGQARLALAGRVFDLDLDSLRVEAEGRVDSLRVPRLRLLMGGFRADGEASWDAETRRGGAELWFQGLDLAGPPVQRFRPGLPRTRLDGRAEVEARLGDDPLAEAHLDLAPGMVADRAVPSVTARGGLRGPGLIEVDSLWIGATVPPLAAVSGVYDQHADHLDFDARFHRLDLDSWVVPWLPERRVIRGAVSGGIHLTGGTRHPLVRGALDVGTGEIEGVAFDSLHVDSLGGSIAPLHISARLDARRLDIHGLPMDSVRGEMVVAETLDVHLAAFHDTTRIDLAAQVLPREPGWADLGELRVRAGSLPELSLAEPTRLHFSKTRVSIDSVRVQSPMGAVAGSGWIEPRPNHPGSEPFAFQVSADSLDFRTIGAYLRAPVDTLNGIFDLRWHGEGTVDEPRYDVLVTSGQTETYGWLWDSVRLRLRAGALSAGRGSVVIDTLRMEGSGYAGRLPRIVEEAVGPSAPAPPTELLATGVRLDFDTSWKEALRALADSALVPLGDASVAGSIRTRDVSAVPFLAWALAPRNPEGHEAALVQPLNPYSEVIRVVRAGSESAEAILQRDLRGRFSAWAELGGTGRRPEFSLHAAARKVQVYEARADSVILGVRYAPGRLDIDDVAWHLRGATARTTGMLPVELGIADPAFRFGAGQMQIETELPNVDLALLTAATNLIVEPSGTLSGKVRLYGRPSALRGTGQLKVENGAFRIPNREERLSNVTATIDIDSVGFHIQEAKGNLNGTGQVTARGYYRDPNRFELAAEVRDGPVFETGHYRFVANADLYARPVADGDTLRPKLTGRVRVQEGLITLDLSKPPENPQILRTPWLIDLTVELRKNVSYVLPVTNVQLSSDSLRVRYRQPLWNLAGEVEVESGRYRLFDRYFNVESGTITFEDDGTGPHPLLDVTAVTSVPDPSPDADAGARDIDITVTVSGEAGRIGPDGRQIPPTITLSSVPERDQNEIIRLLSVGQLGAAGQDLLTTQVAGSFTGELAGRLEQELIGRLPYSDRIQLLTSGAAQGWELKFRPIVTRQWNVSYTQAIADAEDREIALNYRLSDLFYLRARNAQARDIGNTLENQYSIDLRFRVEY